MRAHTLKLINDTLTTAGISYGFERWNGAVTLPYWVGEYSESPSQNEDLEQDTEFILTGTDSTWIALEEQKETIRSLFRELTHIFEDGEACAIWYDSAFGVPVEDDAFKRMQINLLIKEWSVN